MIFINSILGRLEYILIKKSDILGTADIEVKFNSSEKEEIIFFKGCRNIELEKVNFNITLLMNIYDIKDSFLENLNYEINEAEEGMISFMCKDIVYNTVLPQ